MTKQRFRYSASILKASHTVTGIGALLAFLLASLLVLELPNLAELNFSDLFRDENGSVAFEWYLVAVCGVLGVFVVYMNNQVFLEIDSETLKIHVPRMTGLGLFGFTTGDHRIPLHSITKVELVPVTGFKNMAQALQQSKLILSTESRTYRLQPYQYLKAGQPDHRIGFGRAFGKPKTHIGPLITDAPLVRALTELTSADAVFTSIPADRTGPLADHFDLMKHKGMAVQLVLLAAISTYALVDYVLLTEYLVAGDLPIWPFVSVGLLTGALGVRLGKGAPVAERLGLAALLSVASLFATYPGLQRYTLLVSPDPLSVHFQSTQAGYFEHPDYPAVDQTQSSIAEYWQSRPPRPSTTFQLHESGLGFVLVDMAPVYADSRAFYQSKDN